MSHAPFGDKHSKGRHIVYVDLLACRSRTLHVSTECRGFDDDVETLCETWKVNMGAKATLSAFLDDFKLCEIVLRMFHLAFSSSSPGLGIAVKISS